jgi:hypothetical protein
MTIGHITSHIINELETPPYPYKIGLKSLKLHSQAIITGKRERNTLPGILHEIPILLWNDSPVQVVAHEQVFVRFEEGAGDAVVPGLIGS